MLGVYTSRHILSHVTNLAIFEGLMWHVSKILWFFYLEFVRFVRMILQWSSYEILTSCRLSFLMKVAVHYDLKWLHSRPPPQPQIKVLLIGPLTVLDTIRWQCPSMVVT